MAVNADEESFVSDFWISLRALSKEEVDGVLRFGSEFLRQVLCGTFTFRGWRQGALLFERCFTEVESGLFDGGVASVAAKEELVASVEGYLYGP